MSNKLANVAENNSSTYAHFGMCYMQGKNKLRNFYLQFRTYHY